MTLGSLFVTSYTLALGNPVPHSVPAAVVGYGSAGPRLSAALPHGIELRRFTSLAAARKALDEQQVYAVLDERTQPRLLVASAAGASVARVLSAAAAREHIATADTHPLPRSDPQGLDVFYLVLAATIVGFVTVFQLRANAAGMRLRAWMLFLACFALTASVVLSLVVGSLLHRLALPLPESAGILALQIFTAACFNSTMVLLAGPWAIVPTWLFFVVLGNTSSGGAVAPPLLPRPFELVSQWLPSGAAVSSLRNAVYFGGHQQWRPVAVLGTWACVCALAMVVVSRLRGTSPGVTTSSRATTGHEVTTREEPAAPAPPPAERVTPA